VLLDVNVTTAPPVGAAVANVTVPWSLVPPTTELELLLSVSVLAELIVRVAVALVAPVCDAVIVELVFDATAVVVTVNVAVVAPEATLTVAGTVALVLLDDSEIVNPLGPAAADRVIVPVELVPPVTDVGLKPRVHVGTSTVSVALADWPPAEAPIVLVVLVGTPMEVTVKVAVVAPAGTVTVAGTVAAAVLLDVNATDIPPVGAALPRVTIPVEGVPPTTVVGLSETAVTTGGLTVRVAVWFDEPSVAVIVEVVAVATAVEATVKVALVCPDATVTEVGTVAAEALEARPTV
jgi:hypothetical protein